MINLNPDLRQSFRSIARTLGVDQDTARNRLRRLEKSGFIRDWHLLLNPSILGLHYSTIRFDVPSSTSKKELIPRLKLIPGVFLLMNWYRRGIGIVLLYDTVYKLKSSMDMIRSLSNTANLERSDVVWPECKISMSVTDRRILRSLRGNPRKSYSSIAHEARISQRTAERRLERMIQAKALFALPALNARALQGTVIADLEISHSLQDAPFVRRKISQELNDYVWHMFFTVSTEPNDPTSNTVVNLALPSVVKAGEILDMIENEEAVKNPRMDLWEECFTRFQAQDHYIEEGLDKLGIK